MWRPPHPPALRLVRLSFTSYKSSLFRKKGQPSKHQFYRRRRQQIFKKRSSLLQMNNVSCQNYNDNIILIVQAVIGQVFKKRRRNACNKSAGPIHLAASHTTRRPQHRGLIWKSCFSYRLCFRRTDTMSSS